MENFLNKKYRLESTDEHFDAYLRALGMNFFTRKLATKFASTTFLSKSSDDEYTITTSIPIKTHVQKIKLGEAIEQYTMDGRKIKNTFKVEGDNKLIEEQIDTDGDRKVVIVREFFDSKMLGTVLINDVISKHTNLLIE